jgi:hypothetical protein
LSLMPQAYLRLLLGLLIPGSSLFWDRFAASPSSLADVLQPLFQRPRHQKTRTLSRAAVSAAFVVSVERSPRSTVWPKAAWMSSLIR